METTAQLAWLACRVMFMKAPWRTERDEMRFTDELVNVYGSEREGTKTLTRLA